jgi:serine/threonine-protein kinase
MSGPDAQFVDWTKRRVGAMVKDKYRVDAWIGIGGMATIYAATHRNGRRVALKILHPELTERDDLRQRFRRECQAANAVNHPGAVAIIDDDIDDDGSAFLVMELLEGKSVEALWQEQGKRLPATLVLAIAREVCEVLSAAHRAGIVHRDIKPENIFLTNDAEVKLLDFGLAHLKDATGQRGDTRTGMVFGTPAFMPPEQASGRTSEIDERTDLWALGASMFTLISGHPVHEGESNEHVTRNASLIPARPFAEVLPDAHPVLADFIDRSLVWEKDRRWANANAMRDAIRGACLTLFGDEKPELLGAEDLTAVGGKAIKTERLEAIPPDDTTASAAGPPVARAEFNDDTQVSVNVPVAAVHARDPEDDDTQTNVRGSASSPTEEHTSVMIRVGSVPNPLLPPPRATAGVPNAVLLPWILAGIATLVAVVAVWFAVSQSHAH